MGIFNNLFSLNTHPFKVGVFSFISDFIWHNMLAIIFHSFLSMIFFNAMI
ncbi:hypothetical protein PROPEN_00088 [Proteus penneri ATCC 35198]|nr:hypothetical protein PROPEN_00088 [Proteus penneri ATCC 35198]